MRLLKPKDITDVDTLFDSLEWDMIELDFSIDKDDLESYHKELRSRLQHLCFNFNSITTCSMTVVTVAVKLMLMSQALG